MQLYLNYFWFLCAAVMLLNIAIFRRRFAVIVDRGTVTRAEADHFFVWVAVWFVGAPLVAGAISIAAGWTSPLCAGILQFDSTPKAMFSLLTLAGWLAVLWWIWVREGADFLARVGPALSRTPAYERKYSPAVVRVVVTAWVLISGVGGAIAFHSTKLSPDVYCPARAVAP